MKTKLTLLLIVSAFMVVDSYAQGFYSNGALVSISPNTVLTIPDSLVNKGTLINNGSIRISGAWINTGTYNPGIGQVNFDSNLDQVINHNAQSMERLVISGGGAKEFLADITIHSELTLTDGVLVSKNGARIVMDQEVVITGGSDASHIQGSVERKGDGDWVFPIGNGTNYLPVTIKGVTSTTAFGILTLHELTTSPVLTGALDLEFISRKRYWELSSAGGGIDKATITLPLVGEELLINEGLVTVAGSNNATGPYNDMLRQNFTGNLSLGSVTGQGAPTFKFYTIAATLSDKSVEVFNAVSAGSDGKNDFMEIRNIQFYPGNRVTIHNRWGDRVFSATGYDNGQNSFKGFSENGNKLPAGTYYYTIDLADGSEKITGYLVLR
jgi:gliding motility-associated-like protein